jgi:putative transposon-encoded protein
MIKKVVIPKNNTIKLSIPDNYIGKEIDVLVYAKGVKKEQEQ